MCGSQECWEKSPTFEDDFSKLTILHYFTNSITIKSTSFLYIIVVKCSKIRSAPCT